MGLSRDEAIAAAVAQLATDLGTTETTLLTALGTTETNLTKTIGDTETRLTTAIGDVETNLGADIQKVADFIGKPATNVTEADVDFVVDLLAQTNVNQELTDEQMLQYDVNTDGVVDLNDQLLLETTLQGDQAATGLYLQQEQDTQATQDLMTDLNTQLDTNINTQFATQAREQEKTDLVDLIRQAGDAQGQQVSVSTPDPMDINYLYDFNSIFANPSQAGLFASPYSSTTRAQPQPISGAPQLPTRPRGFAQGGQVGDENDMLLRLLGDMQ